MFPPPQADSSGDEGAGEGLAAGVIVLIVALVVIVGFASYECVIKPKRAGKPIDCFSCESEYDGPGYRTKERYDTPGTAKGKSTPALGQAPSNGSNSNFGFGNTGGI